MGVGGVIVEGFQLQSESAQHSHEQSLSYEGSLGEPEFQERSKRGAGQPIK
jgi:hypothetical protein